MPILRGERVMLRPYRREDLAAIMTWTNDDTATRYLGGRFILPYTEKNAEDYLASVMAGAADKAAFVIADAETEDYLGQIDLDMDMHNRQATLGIVLASERNRGRGIGREAIELICRYGFMTPGAEPDSADGVRGQRAGASLLRRLRLCGGRRAAAGPVCGRRLYGFGFDGPSQGGLG